MDGKLRAALAACALLAAGWAARELAVRSAPLPRDLSPPCTPPVTDRRGTAFFVPATEAAREAYPLPLREMGRWLPLVTVGIEDHRFYGHAGVDWRALAGAAWRNFASGRTVSGASTITQQLIKSTRPPGARTLRVKVAEALGALHLERVMPKQQILEAYLNRLDYGNRRIGPEAAARAYFGKSARDLSLAESIYLAGLPQSPQRLNPWTNPEAARARYERNVALLAKLGLLPEGAGALASSPPVVGRHDPLAAAAHFARLLTDSRRPGPEERALPSSLDLDLQASAETLLRDHLRELNTRNGRDATVVIIDNATGEVRALACGGASPHGQVNSALSARSCGSTLKPFLYVSAIDHKALTAASLLPDTPDAIAAQYADYDPQNYSGRYLGPVRVREALGNSLNVPAVVALAQVGARDFHRSLSGWGLAFADTFDESGAGFILGNGRVTPLDLAGAYASLARGGMAAKPRVSPLVPLETRRVASAEACAVVTDILCDNSARRATFGPSSPLALPQRTAVKTGTSSGFRDGWCAGFNADHTVVVWAGNLDGQPMDEALAVRSAAPLWRAVMNALYQKGDRPLPEPQESATLHRAKVAAETGLRPRPGEAAIDEWFLAGTEPATDAATWYEGGTLQLPGEYAAWCASPQNRLGAQVRDDTLRIVYPRDGATFALSEAVSPAQQALVPRSTQEGCAWFLNGHQLTAPSIPLERGDWTLEARFGEKTATAHYRVD